MTMPQLRKILASVAICLAAVGVGAALYLKENGEKKALQHYRDLYKQYKRDKNFTLESQV